MDRPCSEPCSADAQDVGEGCVGGVSFAGAAVDLAAFGYTLVFGLKCR